MLVLIGGVGRRAVAEMGVPYDADLFEQVQRAVDGRDVHRWRGLLYLLTDLFRSSVPELSYGFEDELTLWGHAQAAFVQRFAQPGARARRCARCPILGYHVPMVGRPVR